MASPHLSSPQPTWGGYVGKPQLPLAPTGGRRKGVALLPPPSRLTGTEPHAVCGWDTEARADHKVQGHKANPGRERASRGVSPRLAGREVGSLAPSSLPPGRNEVSPQAATAPRSLRSGSRGCSARSRTARGCCLGFTGDGHRLLPGAGGAPANQRAPPSAGGAGGSHAAGASSPRPLCSLRTRGGTCAPSRHRCPRSGPVGRPLPTSAPGSLRSWVLRVS